VWALQKMKKKLANFKSKSLITSQMTLHYNHLVFALGLNLKPFGYVPVNSQAQ